MFNELYLQTQGVCSRQQFWLYGIIPYSMITLLGYFLVWFRILDGMLLLVVGVISLWFVILLTVKRLRAIGVPGWIALLIFVPIPYVMALFYLVLGCIPDKPVESDDQNV